MYKEVKNKIKHNSLEKSFSEEEAVEILKKHIFELSHDNEYAMEKNIKDAFKTGLSVLGLIHGASNIGKPFSIESGQSPREERSAQYSDHQKYPTSYRSSNIRNFVRAVNMNENKDNLHPKEFQAHMEHAQNLYDKYKGDESKMAYAWDKGKDFGPDSFGDESHKNYKDNEFVQKYHQNRQMVEKTPSKPTPSKGQFSN